MDYSQFVFRYDKPTHTPTPSAPKKHKKISLELVFVASILIVVIVVIISSEFLTDNGVITTLKENFLGKKPSTYYVVMSTPFNHKSDALAQATMLRAGGCAGYIYHKNSQYFVAYATYFDKKSAQSVSDKNANTCILEFSSCNTRTYEGRAFYSILNEVITTLEKEICNLNTIIEELATNSLTDSDAINRMSSTRNSLLALKERVYSTKQSDDVENALVSLIEPLFGGVDAVISMNNSRDLLSGTRYVITSEVILLSGFSLQ